MSCSLHNDQPLPPTMFWIKDSEPRGVDFFDSRIIITYDTSTGVSTYTMTTVAFSDAGDYHCEARDANDLLVFSSQTATIVVNGVPAFANLLQPISATTGTTQTFVCSVTAVPTASISWSYNNQVLTNGGQFTISGGILTINSVQMSNSGFYKCSATNSYGKNSTTAKLTVTGTLSLPPPFLSSLPLIPLLLQLLQ